MGCTTNCGPLEEASLELKFTGSDVVESFCNSRLMVCCPEEIWPWTKAVRSHSQYCAVRPTGTVTTAEPTAGWLFQVNPVSVHESVSSACTVTGDVPLAAVKFPNRRSLALLTLVRLLRSNFRKMCLLRPACELDFTANIVSVPKFSAAVDPSRTYVSALGTSVRLLPVVTPLGQVSLPLAMQKWSKRTCSSRRELELFRLR